jgi:hypothetical protein
MTYEITTPANSDKYDLVNDLKVMADNTTGHFNSLRAIVDNKITTGSVANVASLTSTGGGSFGTIVSIRGSVGNGAIYNSGDAFVMRADGSYFYKTLASPLWRSNQPIVIPKSTLPDVAIRRDEVQAMIETDLFKNGVIARDVIAGHDTEEEAHIRHGYTRVPRLIMAQAYNDTGVQSIVTSIGYITDTEFTIKIRNLNSKTSEHYKIFWLAMKPV